jgi:hypothetical protein
LSAFSVLHCGLQEYRMQPLRKGRDRQCKTHPKHVTSAGVGQNRTSVLHRCAV